jgi:hypothetical protein
MGRIRPSRGITLPNQSFHGPGSGPVVAISLFLADDLAGRRIDLQLDIATGRIIAFGGPHATLAPAADCSRVRRVR